MRGLVVILIGLSLFLSLGGTTLGRPGSTIPSGNWVWDYEPITQADQPLFVGAQGVVTTQQRNQVAAIGTIHAAGALAFQYLGVYWFPVGRTYEGVDISRHPDWVFCEHGSTPLAAVRQNGLSREYADLNERGLYDAVVGYLARLRADGYDGVFIDRGTVALAGGGLPTTVSTCTADPVTPGATFAQAYLHVLETAHAMGFHIILNDGSSRPLPASVAPLVDRVLHETSPHTGAATVAARFERRAAEQAQVRDGVSRYIEELKTTQPHDRKMAFYEWAEGALWQIDLTVNAGNNDCGGVRPGVVCWHYGTFPQLTRIRRGQPLGGHPRSYDCTGGSRWACLWVRRWQWALVLVNESSRPIRATIGTGQSTCRVVTDVWSGRKQDGGGCVTRVSLTVPPFGGRILTERPR